MRQMVAAPQNCSKDQRTSSLHEAKRRLRCSDVDDGQVLRDGRSFFLQILGDGEERHGVDIDRRGLHIGLGQKSEMLRDLVFRCSRDQDL